MYDGYFHPVIYCIALISFRKASIFSKINSALYYYEFSYIDLKYLNKNQQCFVNFLTEWCVLSVIYVSIQGSVLYYSIGQLIASVATIKF